MVSLALKPMIPNLGVIPDQVAGPASPQNLNLISQSEMSWSTPMRQSVTWVLSISPPPTP